MNSPDERTQSLLRSIPQVNELIEYIGSEKKGDELPRAVLLDAAQSVLDDIRSQILKQPGVLCEDDLQMDFISSMVVQKAWQAFRLHTRRVINATGVIIHTNLGRSPLSQAALDAIVETSRGYCNLEYRLEDGERGSRQERLEELLCYITGAEGAMVVNNNAAAVLLALAAVARGREVVVSRGELVEIGDSFRLPEIMAQSGAQLVEVGTTNRTRLSDYAGAIGPDTGALMKIHQSNFRMVGYTEGVPLKELAGLAAQHSVASICDLGSGSVLDLNQLGLEAEPTLTETVSAGADLVTASGDKLLGGPQAGIVVGSRDYIEALRKHPLARAVRVDKMTVAALEVTLKTYIEPGHALASIPTMKMLSESAADVRKRAVRLRRMIRDERLETEILQDVSRSGGGTLPTCEIPTFCLALTHRAKSAQELETQLRKSDPPVIGRLRDDRLLLDLRTVADEEVPALAKAVQESL